MSIATVRTEEDTYCDSFNMDSIWIPVEQHYLNAEVITKNQSALSICRN